MKRWLYIGGGIVIGLLVVIAIGLYFLVSSLDSIVKTAIEKYGSDMTQASVKLNDVEIELSSGKGALRELTVGNPPGFKSQHALSFGELSLQLDVGSVTNDPVVIKEISITAPEVTYEYGLKGSNVDALTRNIDAYAGAGKDRSKREAKPEEADKEGKKLIIDHLYVRNGIVQVSATELEGKTASAQLPDIHLTDIGKKSGGATAAEVAEQVLAAISKGAASAAAKTNISGLVDAAKGRTGGVAEEASKEGSETFKKMFGK